MADVMLHLYEKGHRNFCFLVTDQWPERIPEPCSYTVYPLLWAYISHKGHQAIGTGFARNNISKINP